MYSHAASITLPHRHSLDPVYYTCTYWFSFSVPCYASAAPCEDQQVFDAIHVRCSEGCDSSAGQSEHVQATARLLDLCPPLRWRLLAR